MMWSMAIGRKTAFSLELQFGNKTPPRWWGFCFILMLMENEPDTTNVHYIDEYPELAKRVWLRRLAQQRALGKEAVCQLIVLPEPPDGAA